MQRSNRETIAVRGRVEVATLARVGPTIAELAGAGATLALRRWLADG
jgi:ATP phosphoribosyltransferase